MKRKLLSLKIGRKNLLWLLFCLVSTSCQRTIYWDLGAKGTLKDEAGLCFPSSLSGTFYNGIIPGSDTAFMEVKVNVFSPGTYTVSTDLQNGLQFIDSGYFSTTGMHTIKLKPSGKAISPAPTNFTIRFDTSTCAFTLNIEDSSLLNKDLNTWSFTDTKNKISYQGVINATYFLSTSENNLLSLRQESTNPGDTIFQVGVAFQGPLGPGIFKTDTLNNLALSTNGRCINCAWGVIFKLKGAVTTIVIQSYDPRTKIIKGTFSGTTVDWNESVATIEDGKFSAVLH